LKERKNIIITDKAFPSHAQAIKGNGKTLKQSLLKTGFSGPKKLTKVKFGHEQFKKAESLKMKEA